MLVVCRSSPVISFKLFPVHIRTRPFHLNRIELSLLSATEYLRMFWWYVAIIPAFGLALLIFATGPLQMIGLPALLWPLTIPGRSFLTSSKSSRLFTQPCTMEADEAGVTFYSVSTQPKQLRYVLDAVQIRDCVDRGDLLLIRTRKLGFAPVKKAAFRAPQDVQDFQMLVQEMVEARLSQMPDV
jgi:hypothetical protein